jgi:hypothetical protein
MLGRSARSVLTLALWDSSSQCLPIIHQIPTLSEQPSGPTCLSAGEKPLLSSAFVKQHKRGFYQQQRTLSQPFTLFIAAMQPRLTVTIDTGRYAGIQRIHLMSILAMEQLKVHCRTRARAVSHPVIIQSKSLAKDGGGGRNAWISPSRAFFPPCDCFFSQHTTPDPSSWVTPLKKRPNLVLWTRYLYLSTH